MSYQLLPDKNSDHWAALTAGFLGWTLDAFDFFLVIFCLTAIGRDFHESDKSVSLSIALTLGFRPVGALPVRLSGRPLWPPAPSHA